MIAAEQIRELVNEDGRELQKQYTGNWIWRAVAALVDVKEINPSPRVLAQKLDVSVLEVVDALEGLEKLGIIKRTEEGYVKILKYVYFSDRSLEPRAVLADHVLISTQINSRLDPTRSETGCFYRTGFVATDRMLAKDFFKATEDLMKKFLMDSSRAKIDALYGFTFSGVDIANQRLAEEKR